MKEQRGLFLIWLLAWVSGAIGCATPSSAPKASQAVARETAVVVSFDPAPAPPGGVAAVPAELSKAQLLPGEPEETIVAKEESPPQLPPGPDAVASALPEAKEIPAPASKLLAIQQRSVTQGVQFDFVGDGRLSDYDAFHLSDPTRVAVDLFGVRTSEVKKEMLLDDALVRKVRVGVHEGKVRVVFDVIPAGGMPYRVEAQVDKLAVTFKPGSGFPSR